MKHIFILLILTFLSTGAMQAQWRELHTGVTENLYDVCCVNANTVFVCGDNGVILKTEDGGETWRELYRQEGRELCKIAFANQNVGYAGGNDGSENGVLIRTTDGGETWEDVNNTLLFKVCNMGLEPISTDTVFAYHQNHLYKSIDAGENFSVYDFDENQTISGIYIKNSTEYVVLYNIGAHQVSVLKSDDEGINWDEIFYCQGIESFYDAYYYFEPNNHVIPYFIDECTVKIYSSGKIIQTTDCFANTEMITILNSSFMLLSNIGPFDMAFSSENYGCYIANLKLDKDNKEISAEYNDSWAEITNNGGTTWFNISGLPIHGLYYYSVAASPDTSFYVTSESGRIYKYDVNMPIQDINEQKRDAVNIFPNPTYDKITIEGKEIKRVEIYDLVGREIMSQTYASKDKIEMDLSDAQDGLYIIKVYDKNDYNELKINKIK